MADQGCAPETRDDDKVAYQNDKIGVLCSMAARALSVPADQGGYYYAHNKRGGDTQPRTTNPASDPVM